MRNADHYFKIQLGFFLFWSVHAYIFTSLVWHKAREISYPVIIIITLAVIHQPLRHALFISLHICVLHGLPIKVKW